MRQSSNDFETCVRRGSFKLLVLERTTVYDLGDGWAEGNSSLGVVRHVSVGIFLSPIL